eukprot:14884186-Ditylum_brightwellii.AAC.1
MSLLCSLYVQGCKCEPPVVAKIHRRDVTFNRLRFRETDGQRDRVTELFLIYILASLCSSSAYVEALCDVSMG